MTEPAVPQQGTPSVSVVIPAYGPSPVLPQLVERLCRQTLRPAEIIVVHSGPGDPRGALPARQGLRIIHSGRRLFAGAARNLALREASGDWIACIDSDVLPGPAWLSTLLEAARENRFVVGAIASAGTGGYWGSALWAIEFSSVHPYLPDGPLHGGASASMLVPRQALLRAGGFPDAFRAAEDTVLQARLRALGLAQWFCAGAPVLHHDIPGLRHFARHLVTYGRWFVAARRVERLEGRWAVRFWPLAPFLWPVRFALCWMRLLRWGGSYRRRCARLAPAMLLGCVLWNLGVLAGLLDRVPDSRGSLAPKDDRTAPAPETETGEAASARAVG